MPKVPSAVTRHALEMGVRAPIMAVSYISKITQEEEMVAGGATKVRRDRLSCSPALSNSCRCRFRLCLSYLYFRPRVRGVRQADHSLVFANAGYMNTKNLNTTAVNHSTITMAIDEASSPLPALDIPVINISGYLTGDIKATRNIALQLNAAAQSPGFFQIVSHNLSLIHI